MSDPGADEWIPITTHEIYYLLSLGDGPQNEASRRRLGLIEGVDNVDMAMAGASTLVVRGMASLANELTEPVDQAALLAWLLSTAHTWVEVGVTTGNVADALLTASNDEVAAVLVPTTLGIFRFVMIDPGTSPGELALSFVEGVFENNPQAAVSVRRTTSTEERSAGASMSEDGWRMVKAVPTIGHEPLPLDCTRAQALGELASVLR